MWQFQPRTFIPWYLQIVSPLNRGVFTVLLGMGLLVFSVKIRFMLCMCSLSAHFPMAITLASY